MLSSSMIQKLLDEQRKQVEADLQDQVKHFAQEESLVQYALHKLCEKYKIRASKCVSSSPSSVAIKLALEDDETSVRILAIGKCKVDDTKQWQDNIPQVIINYIEARLAGQKIEALILDYDLGAVKWNGAMVATVIRKLEQEFKWEEAYIYPNSSSAECNELIIAAAQKRAVDLTVERLSKAQCLRDLKKKTLFSNQLARSPKIASPRLPIDPPVYGKSLFSPASRASPIPGSSSPKQSLAIPGRGSPHACALYEAQTDSPMCVLAVPNIAMGATSP